ncbi:MAG: STAS/SEC14 domain-containing protein [Spongiibacteraceae bacterium]
MFNVMENGDNRLDIEVAGKLDSEAMNIALDELMSKSDSIEHGTMLYTLNDFKMPTLGAIGVELSRIPSMFRFVKKFDRAAVLSDKRWVRRASKIEGALIRGLTIEAFELKDKDQAEAWLAQPH